MKLQVEATDCGQLPKNSDFTAQIQHNLHVLPADLLHDCLAAFNKPVYVFICSVPVSVASRVRIPLEARIYVRVFLCRKRPCEGPIHYTGNPTKMSKWIHSSRS